MIFINSLVSSLPNLLPIICHHVLGLYGKQACMSWANEFTQMQISIAPFLLLYDIINVES